MTDFACTFGQGESLVGILSRPEDGIASPEKPAVLLLNANVLHRVGPYRLYVRLARKLCTMGFYALRFDLSGIGDSPQRKSDLAYDDRVVTEIKEAMDFVANETGATKFVLMGLCAGADSAYRAAVADPRVGGLVLLDGFGYRTPGYYLRTFVRYYFPRFFNIGVWKRFFAARLRKTLTPKQVESPDMSDFYSGVRKFPQQHEMEADLKNMIARNMKLLCIFTGGLEYLYYNYKDQFQDMFKSIDFSQHIQVVYYPHAAHIFPRLDDRLQLIDDVTDWFSRNYNTANKST